MLKYIRPMKNFTSLGRYFSPFICLLYPRHTKYVVIPPTYEIYGGGYNVFAFPFVRMYVRLFVFLSQGQSFCIKIYRTSYFEDPLMDFIHIWHDGRYRSEVFISTMPTPGVTLVFIKKSKFFVFKFI